jgi:predicted phage baseplate assembly protein
VLGGNLEHWLGCRLRSALPAPDHKSSASPRLSAIDNLILTATWATAQTELAAALFNTTPVDISKDFFPFGPNPQFGDVFYLSCSAWDRPGAEVTLDIKLTNPASGGATLPIPPVNNTGKPDIRWEYWSGDKWTRLSAHDGTQNLTESGSVSFQIPDSLGASSVHGVNGHWVRARMACGNYGHTLQSADDGAVSPPSIESMKVSVSHFIGPVKPEKIVTHNNLMFDVVDKKAAFIPFCAQQKNDKAIYFGFTAPREDARNACRKALDLYFHIGGSQKRLIYRIGGATRLPVLNWEYFNGDGWQTAQVEDDTDALTMSGMVRIAVAGPMGALNRSVAPPGLYWVRAVWRNGDYGCRPLLRRVMMNTVPVDHAMTLANEILGSSNGLPQQTFRSARAPLLNCIRLEVIEPEMPSESELRAIRHLEGHDAVRIVDDAQGRPKQIWVRWHQANDFLKSKNRDRHFSVDHQTGKICFGDGIKGMIPPAGSNNVRLARYRTGGGETGNKPIDSITQLRSSLAFIASCTNTEPATGGQAFETWDALKKRGAAGLRHRHRAVTLEDFEDLAVLASPAVARAKCYPNRDLATDQDAQLEMPGVASLIVIPHGTDRKPAPNPGLLRRVGEYIDCHKPADTELVILGPEYVSVNIEMVIVPHAGESGTLLASRCQQAIQRLLHPINGGAVGQGWSFGSLPNDSDILGFCDNIDGLDRVGHLHIRFIEDRPGLLKSGLFLAAAGHLDVLAEF